MVINNNTESLIMIRSASGLVCLAGMAIYLQGCVPVAVVGAATTVGSSLAEERGIGGTISDSGIRTQINALWVDEDPSISSSIELQVREGRVLLTGPAKSNEQQIKAVQLCWKVKGVREVIDETTLADGTGATGYASDTWITTKLKSEMLFTYNLESINYNIKTVNGKVYIMGAAKNQAELDMVVKMARGISGVKDVVNYARLRGNPILNQSDSTYADNSYEPQPNGFKDEPIYSKPINSEPITSTPITGQNIAAETPGEPHEIYSNADNIDGDSFPYPQAR